MAFSQKPWPRLARSLAGRDVSPDKLRRMRAWFARHESDKRPGWDRAGKETPGYVAWLLWGGDAGRSWAIKMVAEMNRIDSEKERGRDEGHQGPSRAAASNTRQHTRNSVGVLMP
jgi:hypothetical protein